MFRRYNSTGRGTLTASSKPFTKYNLFEFIKKCYDVLRLYSVDYVVESDIANRINNKIFFCVKE